jgi:hydrogenase maturation factor
MTLIPGVGPFLAGGYLGTVLIAAGGGAAAGGLLGGLTGMGMDEDEAKHYDEQFRAGRVVVTVNAGGRYTEAADILAASGGQTFRQGGIAAASENTAQRL